MSWRLLYGISKLWNYYRDEKNADGNENNAADNMINNDKTIVSKYFEYNSLRQK